MKRTEVRASITAVLALLFVATTPAASATTTWDGSSSGFSNTAANWAEHAVPGNKVRLSWPTRAAGYQLESRPTLSPTSWSGVMNESLVNGGNFNVTSNPAGTNQFYRLRKSLP